MAAAGLAGLTPGEAWTQVSQRTWLALGIVSPGIVSPGSERRGPWNEERRERLDRWERQEAGEAWVRRVTERCQHLEEFRPLAGVSAGRSPAARPLVLLAEANPLDFLGGFWAAVLAEWDVALANPQWGQQEWQSVGQLLCPQVVWASGSSLAGAIEPVPLEAGAFEPPAFETGSLEPSQGRAVASSSAAPCILIPTGGSSGQVKFARHQWATLMASVAGFCQYFQPAGAVNACCVLPVHHVSGLVQVLRAWASGGQVVIAPSKYLETSTTPQPLQSHARSWFVSLVPTQLHRLLQAGRGPWLSQFRAVLLGGAPTWPALLDWAAAQRIPICLSYGTTETAAMVAAQSPRAFLAGDRSSGQALPHARVQILRDGQALPPGEIGRIEVRSEAIARGYYQQSSPAFSLGSFDTDDLGFLSADGHLHVTGRASSKIISGGENIFPAEVEAALRNTDLVEDVCVLGLPHPQWGEAVTAAYVPIREQISAEQLQQAIAGQLSRYKQPKQWIPLARLPRNAQGKLNRRQLLAQLLGRPAPASKPDRPSVDGGDGPAR